MAMMQGRGNIENLDHAVSVQISNYFDAVMWCSSQFGSSHAAESLWGYRYDFVLSATSDGPVYRFYFKHEADATFFALRWVKSC